MAALTVTAAKVSASWDQGAIIRHYVVADAITSARGKAIALDANGKAVLADANGSATLPRAIGICVETGDEYGEANVAANGTIAVCVFGPVYGFSGLTPGAYGWVGTTAGEVVDAAPSTAYQYVIGQAVEDDVFFVNPGLSVPNSAA